MSASFILAIIKEAMNITKLIPVIDCQNLFLPLVFKIVKYEEAVKNKNDKNNKIGKKSGTANTIDFKTPITADSAPKSLNVEYLSILKYASP